MAEIEAAGLARATDQGRRPGLLMEGLVPDLDEMIGRGPARTNPGIRAVEEEQAAEPLRMLPRQALGNIGADVMRDDAGACDTKVVHEGKDIGGVDIGGPGRRGGLWRGFR